MIARRHVCCSLALLALPRAGSPAVAQDRIKVVATFSILGDLVQNVGGDRVEVATLVGPNGDAHVYSPTPADARTLGAAKVVVVNGLGLEGWMTRLVKASGTKAPIVVASNGVKPRKMEDERPSRPRGDRSARLAVGRQRQDLRRQHPRRLEQGRSRPARPPTRPTPAAYLAKLDALEQEVKRGDRENSRRPPQDHHHPRRLRLFRRRLRHRVHRAGRRLDRLRALGQGRREDHRADQEAENPGGVHGEHHRSAADAADRHARPAPRSAARSIPTRCPSRAVRPPTATSSMMRNNIRELEQGAELMLTALASSSSSPCRARSAGAACPPRPFRCWP